MKSAVLMAALSTSLIAGVASAEGRGHDGPGMQMPSFEQLDADGDGQLTLQEAQAAPAIRFAAADIDGDGTLTVEELTAMILAEVEARISDRVANMIEEFDDNGDGVLSADEMPSASARQSERMFNYVDEDEDGAVTLEEFDAAKSEMDERRGGRDGGHGRRRHN